MRSRPHIQALKNPAASARAVGLRYVNDGLPGIRREGRPGHFCYRDPSGKFIRHGPTLRRIRSLAIPPAWIDVWICPGAEGHLQATGRDARRRKQFRYHPGWRRIRDQAKFELMIDFARALPAIRRRVSRDLAASGLPKNKILAAVVRLLEVSLIRVGNDEYARQNHSFGLTTLRDGHVQVQGTRLHFRFRGKSGKWREVDIDDQRLARVVKRCQELPGQQLFQYADPEGRLHDVSSNDVNDYLRAVSGRPFTAKDFRTWAGTVLAARALLKRDQGVTRAQAQRNIAAAIQSVAKKLGNTPAVCKKCYIHPRVFDSYRDGTFADILGKLAGKQERARHQLSREETAVLALLRRRLTLEQSLRRSLAKERRR